MTRKELKVMNPYTEKEMYSFPMDTMEEAIAKVEKAHKAYQDWKCTSIETRKQLCLRFMEEFEKSRDKIAREITEQMGKPLWQSQNEVNTMLDRAQYMIGIAEKTLADEYLPEKPGFVRYIRHEPIGVVLDISAWNYPLLIAVNVIVPAIMAGNAVIVKHARLTPLCGKAFVECFEKAGAPEGLIQDLIADHQVVDAVIKHPKIGFVSFTGSVRGGHEIVQSASTRFINQGLELGGKDPAYVCADAPFDFAVANCVDGAFYNAGQSCCAVERIYVEKPIYEKFVEAFVELTRQYKLGDPMQKETTIGPLAVSSAREFLKKQVEEAVAMGGTLVVSPSEFETPNHGWFFAPAVVANAPQKSSLMQEESFGTVIGILPVSGDEEAITYMNDSPYGLTASIWTSDFERAKRIGERVETGTFYMNRCDYLDPALPWTGVKDTGRGASLSHYGYYQLTQLKSMHLRTQWQ
ncbi:MAG TPA: aldehyde dehydrogenase family protein [Candidatus Hydrogenedens sp.]|nr:aldehyde dehydrogenase family protein [Candidatus Hydrogenedens sp.]